MWRKIVPERRDTLPAKSTLARDLYEKKVDPSAQAKSTGAYFDFLALTELTRLGEPKRLYGKSWSC